MLPRKGLGSATASIRRQATPRLSSMSQTELIAYVVAAAGGLSLLGGAMAYRKAKRLNKSQLESFVRLAPQYPEAHSFLSFSLRTALYDLQADSGAIYLADAPGADALQLQVSFSLSGLEFQPSVMTGCGVSGVAYQNRQRLAVRRGPNSPGIADEFDKTVNAALCVPISLVESQGAAGISYENPIGVLTIVAQKKGASFTKEQVERAEAYAHVISMALANIQLRAFTQNQILSSLTQIATLLEAKDPQTSGHCDRVAEIADLIAAAMGLNENARKELRDAIALLDIGKVAIPDSILHKRSGLTDEEFAIVKHHPVMSYEICKNLRLPESLLLLVRNHHERLDGTGYPDGLRGPELPLTLRIVSVADAYDAMRCSRPHRRSMTDEETLALLLQDAGTKFDPEVVDAVRELVESGAISHLYPKLAVEAKAA